MGNLVFQATLGGQVNLVGPNTASTYNLNVPAVAGTLVTTGDTGTVTSTMLASSVYTAPGTIGSGTPNTGAFTTLTLTNALGVAYGGTNATSFTGKSGNVAGLVFYDGTKLTNDATVTDVGYDTSTNTVKANNLSIGGTQTYADGSTQNTAATGFGFKNRIINGAMMIDQRNAGASVTVNSVAFNYTLDRWFGYGQVADGVFTVQRSTTAPTGFTNSALLTVTTADASIGSAQVYGFGQKIEGFNVADFGWGTASAQNVTLSFQVRSSVTGTYSVTFFNGAFNRGYTATFNIAAANTFETKTITIPGDTSGTWTTDNSNGLTIWISLGTGSTYTGTAGTWNAGTTYAATGQINLIGTNGATFYITGVQLEKGSTATSFDYRSYGTELALCQRYYSKSYATETAPATATTVNAVVWLTETTSSYTNRFITFPVTMRSTPTFTAYSPATGTSGKMRNVDTATDISVNVKNSCIYSGGISVAANNELNVHWTASAEL